MYIGEGNGNPLQYSCLENPMDRGAWWAAVYRVARSQTGLSDWLHFHFHALKKEMATHSSVLALRIPGTGEPGGLWSMGLHSVEHDWSNLAAAAAACIYIYTFPPLWTVLWFCGPERVTSVIFHTLLQWRNPDQWETVFHHGSQRDHRFSLFCR